MNRSIEVLVNGERRSIPEGLDITGLLDYLGLKGDRVAVEVNRKIVKRDDWEDRSIRPDDSIEIVHFVGGGAN